MNSYNGGFTYVNPTYGDLSSLERFNHNVRLGKVSRYARGMADLAKSPNVASAYPAPVYWQPGQVLDQQNLYDEMAFKLLKLDEAWTRQIEQEIIKEIMHYRGDLPDIYI